MGVSSAREACAKPLSSDPLVAQYEQWIYPQPIPDLDAYVRAGGFDYSDPKRVEAKIWPHTGRPDSMRILVAGCGANQAAILAHANPEYEVVGIDLSESALQHHRFLKNRHGLKNLTVKKLAVEDARTLVGRFDYIVSTGVLHHLSDPERGLSSLTDVLTDDGAISLMLYGLHARAGVYMLQDALRRMGAGRDEQGVALARAALAAVPSWHSAATYAANAPDMGYDAGIVDTLLNARERAYAVPDIMRLLYVCGLEFGDWLDRLHYSPDANLPPGSPLLEQLDEMNEAGRWHVVDLLTQRVGAHRFIVRNKGFKGREAGLLAGTPEGGDVSALIPCWHPDMKIAVAIGEGWDSDRKGPAVAKAVRLTREWHSLSVSGVAADVINRIDGKTSWGALLDGVRGSDLEVVTSVLVFLVDVDHLALRPARA